MDKKPEKQKKQPRRITGQYLENAALYYLQRHASSVANFRQVMRRKIDRSCRFFQTEAEPFYEIVEKMILRYVATGLLNDEQFAAAKTSSLRRQGKSRNAIQAKLRMKGLSPENIGHAIAKVDEDNSSEAGEDPEFKAAFTFARRKKIGPFRKAVDEELDITQKQKEMAAMARGGFSFDISRRVLDYDGEMPD